MEHTEMEGTRQGVRSPFCNRPATQPPLRVRCGGAGRIRRPSASTSIVGDLLRCREPAVCAISGHHG
jgi:hypothetical protein